MQLLSKMRYHWLRHGTVRSGYTEAIRLGQKAGVFGGLLSVPLPYVPRWLVDPLSIHAAARL